MLKRNIAFLLARKSVKQSYKPSEQVLTLMQNFKQMTNDCIRIGLSNQISTMKKLSLFTYKELKRYGGYSKYRLTAISKAAGILSARKKSVRRGFKTKDPYVKKPILVSCYGFKVINGKLKIPLGNKKFEEIQLNKHTLVTISDPEITVNSFTLTETSLSFCISKEVPEIEVTGAIGIDRNLRNLTIGNTGQVTYYDMSKVVEIGETTRDIIRSFKRNDVRIRRELSSKYGRRRQNRIEQILHAISKDAVEQAKESKQAIIFEDIKDIRNLYRKGNGQGSEFRGRMNRWPFAKINKFVEYKAQWSGVPIIHLTKGETRGSSMRCAVCGERLRKPSPKDKQHARVLWCNKCEKWFDRDMVAVMNISHRGWVRFAQSQKKEGIGNEAMKGNPTTTVISRVDPTKLCRSREEDHEIFV